MVFFVCDSCNETLKKNQVDKHAQRCRSCASVTCVDCSKTFWGDDYAQHTSCISEAEKYEGSLFREKTKKKMNPQEIWNAIVEEACTVRRMEASQNLHEPLSRLQQVENVPRQKKKFVNFVKNSLRLYDESKVDELWNHIEKGKVKMDAGQKDDEKKEVASSETAKVGQKRHLDEENPTADSKLPRVERKNEKNEKKDKKDKKDSKEKKEKKEKKKKDRKEKKEKKEEDLKEK